MNYKLLILINKNYYILSRLLYVIKINYFSRDPFNFKLTSPPLAYCTNIGTNQQVLTNQQWLGCHSFVRIGVPMASAICTGVIKLQMGDECIHISGGGFGTPRVRWCV